MKVQGVGESERFRIDSGVRQNCIISPWLFNVYKKCTNEISKNENGEDGCEISGGGERVDFAWPLA